MNASEALQRIQVPAADRYISVRPAEGEFMHRWVKEHGLSRTLEVGLAFGASTACIMSAHEGVHTCMDPFQEEYNGQGVANVESLGFRPRLEFHPSPSRDVLPRLVAAGRTFDFAFIDGDHRYDAISSISATSICSWSNKATSCSTMPGCAARNWLRRSSSGIAATIGECGARCET